MPRKKNSRKSRRGFTLMEVLLVMAILVILGSLVTVSYITIQHNSKISTAKLQIQNFRTALDIYSNDVGSFPQTLQELRTPPANANGSPRQPFMDVAIPLDPWGNDYQYSTTEDQTGRFLPLIISMGPDGQQGTDDDIKNQDAP